MLKKTISLDQDTINGCITQSIETPHIYVVEWLIGEWVRIKRGQNDFTESPR